MKFWQLLALPWRVSQKDMRWLALVLFTVAALGAASFCLLSHKPDLWLRTAGIIGVAEAMVWSFCLPNVVVLTIDARQLRIPNIQRHVMIGVLLNGMLGSLLPALVIGALGGHAAAIAVAIALMSLGGFLHSLLSRYAALGVYVPLAVVISTSASWQWLVRADFLAWALPALMLGLAVVATCWHRLIVAREPYRLSWNGPPALRLGRGLAAAGRRTQVARFDRRPAWLPASVSLRGCGPGHPVTSLRMALGGDGIPRTLTGWLWHSAVLVVAGVALIGWWWAVWLQDGSAHGLVSRWSTGVSVLLACAAGWCVLQAIAIAGYLLVRWCRVNAELPLLALLPGLGNKVKRDVLRAALWLPACLLLFASVLVLPAVTRIHEIATAAFVALAMLTAAGSVLAGMLLTIGGVDRQAHWERAAAMLLWAFLLLASLLTAAFSRGAQHVPDALRDGLLSGWLLLAWLLFCLSWRGWRGLQRRPHPFLVT